MSWRKGKQVPATTDPKDNNVLPEMGQLSLDDGAVKHKTEKFLVLNILQNLVEDNLISSANFKICSTSVHSSSKFDAKNMMAYAPPHWELAQKSAGLKTRENFPAASLGSCFLLLHEIGAYCRLPWRTIITGSVLLQRFCYVSSTSKDKLIKEAEYLKTLNYSKRVIIVSSCLLLATKMEESLCKISVIIGALKVILGQSNFLNAIPPNKRSTGHIEVDEAMAWPLRIQESIILEVLGFDVEVHHPHFYIPLLHCLPYSQNTVSKSIAKNITLKAFALLDKCVLAADIPLPLFSTPPLVALAATFLAWMILKEDQSDSFNWNILNLTDKHKEELKATVEYMVPIISENNTIENWESYIFESKSHIYHEFKANPCKHVNTIQREEVICEGTYGTVWVATKIETGETVALKQLKNTLSRNGFPYYMLREILFLRRLNHPNVVSGHEVVCKQKSDSTREFYIVMEYISFDMRDLWLAQKDFSAHPLWTEANIKHLTLQLLNAISYMHQRGLMHRDIKLENILFDTGILKVADLGSIRDAGRTALKLTTAVVTLWYRPPELLLGNTHYTNAIDIWSIGCVIVEMLVMNALFPGRDVDDMMIRIVSCIGKPSGKIWQENFARLPKGGSLWPTISRIPVKNSLDKILKGKSEACIDLIKRMICYDPKERISASQAMEHPYFKEDPLPAKYLPRQ